MTCWRRLREIKHVGPPGVLAAIATLNKRVRSCRKEKEFRPLRGHLIERWDMLDYRRTLGSGWDIGSGPTEAMRKSRTQRLLNVTNEGA